MGFLQECQGTEMDKIMVHMKTTSKENFVMCT